MLCGPRGVDVAPEDYSQAFAQVISLYPLNLKTGIREGDPICDSYRVHTSETGSIWCIADGCNWGPRPCQAATRYDPLSARSLSKSSQFIPSFFFVLTVLPLSTAPEMLSSKLCRQALLHAKATVMLYVALFFSSNLNTALIAHQLGAPVAHLPRRSQSCGVLSFNSKFSGHFADLNTLFTLLLGTTSTQWTRICPFLYNP